MSSMLAMRGWLARAIKGMLLLTWISALFFVAINAWKGDTSRLLEDLLFDKERNSSTKGHYPPDREWKIGDAYSPILHLRDFTNQNYVSSEAPPLASILSQLIDDWPKTNSWSISDSASTRADPSAAIRIAKGYRDSSEILFKLLADQLNVAVLDTATVSGRIKIDPSIIPNRLLSEEQQEADAPIRTAMEVPKEVAFWIDRQRANLEKQRSREELMTP